MFLLRHGATRLNLEKPYRLQGQRIDEPLGEMGQAQAASARDALLHLPLRAVYSGPLKRAGETAAIVAKPHGLEATIIPTFLEGDVGSWENRTWEEIKATEPQAYQQFIDDPGKFGYEGGENFFEVLKRVQPIFSELFTRHQDQMFAVIGHQIINRTYVADLLGLPMREARTMKFANGSITSITLENGKPVVVSLNVAWPFLLRT
jgi:broad specificity phosphatase PhoE